MAMTVRRTCSLTVKGPGLIETPKILTLGTTRAQRRPRGKESSWATICTYLDQRSAQPPRMRSKNEEHTTGKSGEDGEERDGERERIRTPPTVTEGYRKKKNWFMPGMRMAQMIPMNQARKVLEGMSGSSVLATAERTSG